MGGDEIDRDIGELRMSEEEQDKMVEKISRSEVSGIFRDTFPKEKPTQWEIKHMIFLNRISKEGSVKRRIEICLESRIQNLTYYEWRIPLPRSDQETVHGLSVRNGVGELLSYDLSYHKKSGEDDRDNPDYAFLEMCLAPLQKGQTITLRIEYYIEHYSMIVKRKLFRTLWKYAWSYRVHSETRKFEHRIALPDKARLTENGFSTNMPNPPLSFSYADRVTVIWMDDNPISGDLMGEICYEQESPIGIPIISAGAGALISILGGIVTAQLTFPMVLTLFAISFLGIFGSFRVAQKLLPTLKEK